SQVPRGSQNGKVETSLLVTGYSVQDSGRGQESSPHSGSGEFGCILANSEAVQKRRSGMLRLPLKQAPGASQNRPRDSRFGANPLRVSVCGFRRSVGRGK